MDVTKRLDSLIEASVNSQIEANHLKPPLLPTEDDEIPLDSSSEEPQSSGVSMSDSEDEGECNSLISTGNEHIHIQPLLSAPSAAAIPCYRKIQDIFKKRKHLERTNPLLYTAVSTKKVKLDEGYNQPTSATACPSDKSLLPPEIWHRILSFVPPRTLANLLCLNKLFNVYLDPSSRYQCKFPPSPSRSSITLLKSDAIWQLSRRRFWPRMPAPLQQKTELDMWRLACGKRCQICGKADSASLDSSDDKRHCKSQPVWAFAIRACGSCLVEKTISEVNLLLSSSVPSLLRSALPFVLITSEMDIISPDILQKGFVQPYLQVTKIYLSEHVEELKKEFASVESMGCATAEEWLKGLEARGQESLNDSMRWEKWASSGGVTQIHTQLSPDNVPSIIVASGKGLVLAGVSSLTHTSRSSSNAVLGEHLPDSHHITPIATSEAAHSSPTVSTQNDHVGQMPPYLQHGVQYNAPRVRTREEALELKAARRAEIERRAMELDPPLPANILARIPSFQAAIQIISPLDDKAWDLLKPRLLAQRADAEQHEERGRGDPPKPLLTQERSEERRQTNENSVATKQLIDKTWDDLQAPLRARISAYADEIIRESWNDGRNVDMENSPQFAAEILVHVRRRFYTEIAKEAAETRAAGKLIIEDPPDGPFTQKLTLENMKWLFDVKIKPHTESYRKDLFFCNGCGVNYKAFGFEGVIQHYAAKHTNVLSLGSVVVHWRAEWPETPPFKPDPRAVKTVHPPTGLSHGTLQSQNYAAAYPSISNPAPFQPPSYLAAPPSVYGHLAYGPTPPQPVPYLQGSLYTPGQHEYSSQYSHPSPYPYPNSHPLFPSSSGIHAGPSSYSTTMDTYYGQNHNTYQSNSQPHFQIHPRSSFADIYNAQLEYLARSSRDLWSSTAGLKELPGEIRVCVVLHHVAQRFRSRFSESPTLNLFKDGLSNHKEMRPVRNVNGLMCKACHLGFDGGILADQYFKTYSLPQLVNHFCQSHLNQPQAPNMPSLDWTVIMVHTPNLSALANLHNLANMDSQKYSLITDAFPRARYPDGYPQGAHTTNLPNTQADISIAAREQPTYSAPALRPASLYDASIASDDSITPSTRTNAFGQQPGHNHSVVPSTSTPTGHQNFQSIDSGRESSELWQGPNETLPKRQRGNSVKDNRAMSGQGFRNRKAGGAAASAGINPQKPSDEDLVAEEDRRQEEKIRAMWAADRKEAARLASRTQPPIPTEVPDVSMETLQVERPRSYHSHVSQLAGSPMHSARVQGHQQPVKVREHEEDDLMAGLETQLNQQQVLPGDSEYQPMPARDIQHERQPFSERHVGSGNYINPDQGHPYDRLHSVHTAYSFHHEPRPHFDRYGEGSPGPRSVDMIHGSMQPLGTPDAELYDRSPHQEYHHAYDDESRAQQPPSQYTGAYELVRVRDSAGEYLIRRPIRLEREPAYVPFQHAHAFYGDPTPQHRMFENDSYSDAQIRYESASRTEIPVRRLSYEVIVRPEGAVKTSYEEPSNDDLTGSEDYDPRFPAAAPSSSTIRRAR
ncbi:hypothetical protein M434DRAFT_35872 [Hypoxylon sp. CO27-5]|nr:hypothetical protein M434DRAFT_35872 [Hypoxylon sp. CO27-5]